MPLYVILLLYILPIINLVLLTSKSDEINVSLVLLILIETDVAVKAASAVPSYVKAS